MIDPDRIFNLFGSNQANFASDMEDAVEKFITFKDSPSYKISMFSKIIQNHENFGLKVVQFFNRIESEMSMDDVKNAGEFIVYNRAWFYIQNINLKNPEDFKAIKDNASNEFLTSLMLSISYWEKDEEYEKCGFLKEIQDCVKVLLS